VPQSTGPVVPLVVARGGQGERVMDVYSSLLQQRIIFLGSAVDDAVANVVVAQLLHLEQDDPERDVQLLINSPGGVVDAGLAIYDTMQLIRPDVATWAVGFAASMGQFLLSAGTPGKRYALPNARVLIHQPSMEGSYGQVSDLQIQANEIQRVRRSMEETLARHTNRTVDQVRTDIERDKILTADEAQEYGIVDEVLPYRKLSSSRP
jgi:ATP-dependent Clp protease, protease subunit